jgi:hypothetical protein
MAGIVMDLGIVGLLVGAIGIGVSIVIAYRQRRPKRIAYDFTANRRIITRPDYKTLDTLKVMYGVRSLNDPYLVVVRISNEGKVAIKLEDWQEPLTLQTSSEIIDSAVVGTSSKNLGAEIADRETNEVRCNRMLLNAGEWFDLQLLIDGSNSPELSARIADTQLQPLKRPKTSPRWVSAIRTLSAVGWATIFAAVATVAVAWFVFFYAPNASQVTVPSSPKPPPSVRIPKLIGQPVSQVVGELHDANLHLGREQFIPASGKPGIVIDQYPGPDERLRTGGQVSIVVSQRP